MQVIGTFMPSMKEGLPGVQICPPYLVKKRPSELGCIKFASVLQVNLQELPAEVFCIVPFFFDDSAAPTEEIAQEVCQSASFKASVVVRDDPGYFRSKPFFEMSKSIADGAFISAELASQLDQWKNAAAAASPRKMGKRGGLAAQAPDGEPHNNSSFFRGFHGKLDGEEDDSSDEEAERPSEDPGTGREWLYYSTNTFSRAPLAVQKAFQRSRALQVYVQPGGHVPSASPALDAHLASHAAKRSRSSSSSSSSQPSSPSSKATVTGDTLAGARHNRMSMYSTAIGTALPSASPLERAREENVFFDGYQPSDAIITRREAYAPWALFRRREGRSGWSVKDLHLTVADNDTATVVDCILRDLRLSNVIPFHIVHVEHCVNCEQHAKSSRHVPGSYDKHWKDLMAAISSRLPPLLPQANKTSVCPSPKLGSFELIVKPYFSSQSISIFSKMSQRKFPSPREVLAQLASIVLPERIKFSRRPWLDVHLFSAYHRRPLPNARVLIYRIDTMVSAQCVPLKSTF